MAPASTLPHAQCGREVRIVVFGGGVGPGVRWLLDSSSPTRECGTASAGDCEPHRIAETCSKSSSCRNGCYGLLAPCGSILSTAEMYSMAMVWAADPTTQPMPLRKIASSRKNPICCTIGF